MKTPSCFVVAGALALTISACDSGVVLLPSNADAQSWLLFDEDPGALIFNSNEAVTSRSEVSRLRALPLTREQLGLRGRIETGKGRTIPGLGSYELEDRQWLLVEDTPVRSPFDLNVCQDVCLRLTTCADCDGGAIQGCGPCEVTETTPPLAPSKECPTQWTLREPEADYFECTMDRALRDDVPCGVAQRWSVMDGGCIDFEPCSPPDLDPAWLALYVDPAAAPGGDGSSAAPFADVPQQTPADALVLRPGSYSQLIEVTKDSLRIVGHGACTHLSGGLLIDAQDVVVDRLRVESTVAPLTVRETASVALSNTLIEGGGLVVTSSGGLSLEDSLVIGTGPISSSLRANGQVELRRSDLRLSARLSGLVSVSDSRFLLADRDQILTAGSSVTIARSVILGGGLRLESDTAVITDVLRDSGSSGFDGLELVGFDSRVERSDITASGVAIRVFKGSAVMQQVRLHARQGLATDSVRNSPVERVVVDGAWIQSLGQAVFFAGQSLAVNDLWASQSRDEGEAAGMVLVQEGDVTLRRVFLTGIGITGVFVQQDADIEDLDYRGDRRGFVGPSRLSQGEGFVRGRRWRVVGAQTGAALPRSFDLEDINIKAGPGLAMVPLLSTLDDQSQGRVVRFQLEPSPAGEPKVRIIASDDALGWSLFLQDGELPSSPVSIETNAGANPAVFEALVRYDNVKLEMP